jgi:hypothetical protein
VPSISDAKKVDQPIEPPLPPKPAAAKPETVDNAREPIDPAPNLDNDDLAVPPAPAPAVASDRKTTKPTVGEPATTDEPDAFPAKPTAPTNPAAFDAELARSEEPNDPHAVPTTPPADSLAIPAVPVDVPAPAMPPLPIPATPKAVAESGKASVTTFKASEPAVVAPSAQSAPLAQSGSGPKPLGVFNLAFCVQVHGFGQLEAMPVERITAGRQVLLYSEIRNFSSHEVAGNFETSLRAGITIETTDGSVVASYDFDSIADQCKTKRTDFYCHYTFNLPTKLAPGPYVLRLKVKDQENGQTGERTMPFVVNRPEHES